MQTPDWKPRAGENAQGQWRTKRTVRESIRLGRGESKYQYKLSNLNMIKIH